MIMAKCCHDLDLLQFYANSECESVYSVGDLTYFKKENQPEGASDRCQDCKYINDCPYSAEKIYIGRWKKDPDWIKDKPEIHDEVRRQGWPYNVVDLSRPITEESLRKAYQSNGYGKCVFACDNDVVDNQTTVMKFKNGITANLVMTGFTALPGRKMTFHGTMGEVEMDEENDYIRISRYGKGTQFISIKDVMQGAFREDFGHGGGDIMLVHDFYNALSGEGESGTSLDKSIESHLMAINAERSRMFGGKQFKIHE